jgi:endothelin-converting enzyme/putative endopeptidase
MNVLQVINGRIEALGKLYVEKMPAEAKAKAENDKKHLYCFENRINNLALMSPETKVSAVEKLHMSKIKIDILTNGKIIQP